jgi:hypothetical protein
MKKIQAFDAAPAKLIATRSLIVTKVSVAPVE